MVTDEGHIMVDTKEISNVKDTSQVCTCELQWASKVIRKILGDSHLRIGLSVSFLLTELFLVYLSILSLRGLETLLTTSPSHLIYQR